MSDLSSKTCTACQGGVPPMQPEEIEEHMEKINEDWEAVDDHHLKRSFDFPDFETALEFVNKVGEIAEHEGHHPDIKLTWGEVEIQLYTHKIDGLHQNDFIMASKIDEEYE